MKYWRKTLDREKVKPARYEVHINRELCKGCRFCVEFCPRHVLHESAEMNKKGYRVVSARQANACLDCGLCELVCPEFAITVKPVEEDDAG